MDRCPNFGYNPLHDLQFHQNIQYPSHLVSPLQPNQTHPHIQILIYPQNQQWDHQKN
jgi:hypothetical protein